MTTLPSHILISRTDSIGDVVLTLPLAKFLKEYFPGVRISFLGRNYTRSVIDACIYVDDFIEIDHFLKNQKLSTTSFPDCIIHVFPLKAIAIRARQLKIPFRIGTTNRPYHWYTCNELVRLSRKHSSLHEAQLNLKLLKPFGIDRDFSLKEIGKSFGLRKIETLRQDFCELVDHEKYNIILHPKSQGNGREWGLENFIELIKLLDTDRFKIFISGTEKEQPALKPLFNVVGNRVTDITGKMSLSQFISFIDACDGLVASGTGPIHITAALGKDAFGLYPPIRPIDPGRWQPLGATANVFVSKKKCNACRNNPLACKCMKEIEPSWIQQTLNKKTIAEINKC